MRLGNAVGAPVGDAEGPVTCMRIPGEMGDIGVGSGPGEKVGERDIKVWSEETESDDSGDIEWAVGGNGSESPVHVDDGGKIESKEGNGTKKADRPVYRGDFDGWNGEKFSVRVGCKGGQGGEEGEGRGKGGEAGGKTSNGGNGGRDSVGGPVSDFEGPGTSSRVPGNEFVNGGSRPGKDLLVGDGGVRAKHVEGDGSGNVDGAAGLDVDRAPVHVKEIREV